jgi:hypothetical protein
MRFRFRLAALVVAGVAALAQPSSAMLAVDTTGTAYSTDPVSVSMVFPVAGGVTSYTDTFLVCRSGCARKHMGQDLMGARMTPLVAAFDGVISSLRRETSVGGGNYLVITGDNGWSAVYLHVNNDTPGTDDGRGTASFAFPAGMEVGTRVLAGQLVAWRGDSGNAESTGPHLHFELRKGSGWSGIAYNAYPSLRAARRLAAPLASGPHPDGSLLRTDSGTYFVSDGSLKHSLSAGVLVANGYNPASAVLATAAELRRYSTAPALALRDGALVAAPDGSVWRVVGATRYPATGGSAVPVADVDLAGLSVVEAPTGPTAGMLVRWQNLVYAVDADGLLHLLDRYVMASWGWTAADVIDLPEPPPVPVDPALAPSGDPSVAPSADPGLEPVGPQIGSPLPLRDGTLVAISAFGPAVVSHGYVGRPRLLIPAALVAGLPVGELAGTGSPYRWR